MSTKVDRSAAGIADRLRSERDARSWTLAQLAERSGVSRAMISKIERCEASPTATVLVRLASAFDLTLAGLLARAEADADRLVRVADQALWRDPASGYLRRQVFERSDHPIELVRVDLPAGACVGMPAASYARIRQIVWVLDGTLVIEEASTRRELTAGDCLGFGPPVDTTLKNESGTTCAYVVIVAPELNAMTRPIDIVALRSTPDAIAGLADLLIETVAAGGSVSFMHPLAHDVAAAFWTKSLAAADEGGRVVLGAMGDGEVVATVTLLLDSPPNQPHRGEIAKMMTRVTWRGRGIARALMIEAERIACQRGRTLLTLDTAEEEGAGPFYEKLGFTKAGVIPDYALKPHGGLCGTIIYWKRIGAEAA